MNLSTKRPYRLLLVFVAFGTLLSTFSLSAKAENGIENQTKGDVPAQVLPLVADFDENGIVDAADLIDFLGHTGHTIGFKEYDARYDLNEDDAVDDLDLTLLMETWRNNFPPRTPISPEDLRRKINIFNLTPAAPGDLDQNPKSDVYFFDVVSRDEDGDPLQDSLPAVLAVGEATEECGGSTFSYLTTRQGGFGPMVAGVSDTGPIAIGRLDLLGEVQIDVPTGAFVIEPQNFKLSNPLNFTQPDFVISGEPTISTSSMNVVVEIDPAKSGIRTPFLKGLTFSVGSIVPVTSESTFHDISEFGDWSKIFVRSRFYGEIPVPSFDVGGGIKLSLDFDVTNDLVIKGDVRYVKASIRYDDFREERQYRNVEFENEGCYLENVLEPNNTIEEAVTVPVAGVACVRNGILFHTDAPELDLKDWFSIVPAFDGTMEITCTSNWFPFPVAGNFSFTEGENVLGSFDLSPPPEGVRVNTRVVNLLVRRNMPVSLCVSIPGATSEVLIYDLHMRYTSDLADCVPEVEPNDLPGEAVLEEFGCVTGSVSTDQDMLDVFQLTTAEYNKTAQILLDYRVIGDAGSPGLAELSYSTGTPLSSRTLYGGRQYGFYGDMDKDNPLTFQIKAETGSRVEYSFAYSLTDRPESDFGDCRNESSDNLTQMLAFPVNPPDCVSGVIQHATKGESWFRFQPSEDGVFHVISEVTPEGGLFDGALEIRSADPLSLPIASSALISPATFFPLSAHIQGGTDTFVRFTNDGMIANDGSASTRTSYRFAPENCVEEEEAQGITTNDTYETAEVIGAATCISGSIDGLGDTVDVFSYTETAGGFFWFLIPSRSDIPSESIVATLYDEATLTGVSEPINPDHDTILGANSPQGSSWFLVIASASDSLDYKVRILRPTTCLSDPEDNNLPASAVLVTASVCYQADIGVNVGDSVDYYRVQAAQTGPLRIAVIGGHFGDSNLATVSILDSELRTIQQTSVSDMAATSFDYGAVEGEEILVKIEQDFGPLYYELRVDQP